jgi:hypothetical protein
MIAVRGTPVMKGTQELCDDIGYPKPVRLDDPTPPKPYEEPTPPKPARCDDRVLPTLQRTL